MNRPATTYLVPRRAGARGSLRLVPPSTAARRRPWPESAARAIGARPRAATVILVGAGIVAVRVALRRLPGRRVGRIPPPSTVADLLSEVDRRDKALIRASHDLRTPLTSLKGQAQFLQRFVHADDVEGARLRAGLVAIDAAATAAAERIDRLIDESERRARSDR